ncbi:MAG: cobyrinic acid a,c-diamide synthase [Bacteroidetes bacterium CG12_big_fil_rev_8_21_14_0_65_60_17]|nr:MAG: cobyrinic acid a,c-diamide synthase [Bacteroidetes bacterium CG12_big_fil_rev_8_21_14_0_65_60_17]
MITISVCNHKGGTGKTTSSINLSAALSLSGLNVLVVDLDPQGFLTRMVGVGEPVPAASSAVLFDPDAKADRVLPILDTGSFALMPSSPALSSGMRKLTRPVDVLWLKEFVERDAPSLGYDILLFDTAAAVTVYSLNALAASNHVVIPVLPEYQPVVGAEQTWQTAQMVRKKLNPGLDEPSFLLTMVDGRKQNHRSYRAYMREKYGPHVMRQIIRTCTTLSISHGPGGNVYSRNAHARGAVDYAGAAEELLSRMGRMVEA